MGSHERARRVIGRCGAVCAATLACGVLLPAPGVSWSLAASGQSASDRNASIAVLSSRADLVTGGDALVAIRLPKGADPRKLRVSAQGADVTSAFALRATGRVEGRLSGLRLGANRVVATLPGRRGASIVLTNHPNSGPVFSGPQPKPWTCQATARDRNCNQPARFDFLYQPVGGTSLLPFDPSNPAADVSMTTTDQGVSVPFVVRRETGYQDRNQYVIMVLFDPSEPWDPWESQKQWNHKVLVTHGGSCTEAYASTEARLRDDVLPLALTNMPDLSVPPEALLDSSVMGLGRGFAVMSTALANGAVNCNPALAAESLLMAKERLIEQYGPIRYTIGSGCSGGSLTPQWVSNAYPGIYQGLVVSCSFPDFWSGATAQWGFDQFVLHRYFAGERGGSPTSLTPAQMTAIAGQPRQDNAGTWNVFSQLLSFIDPAVLCPGITGARIYHPQKNPGGTRCTSQDWAPNVLGRRPRELWTAPEKRIGRGFVGLPIGNQGVQYGLKALEQGQITPAQFVEVNVRAGSYDIDFKPSDKRTTPDLRALGRAYRSGMINDGRHLDKVAVINGVGPNDPIYGHPGHNAYITRARLARAFGTDANYAIWQGPLTFQGDVGFWRNALSSMDEWLSAVERDRSSQGLGRKIIANKPRSARDACYDGRGGRASVGACPSVKIYRTARNVAGEPLTSDDNACALKPLRRGGYSVRFTDAEWSRLERVFPDGVCDFSRPGRAKEPSRAWQTYQAADGTAIIGGEPMGPAPTSRPIAK